MDRTGLISIQITPVWSLSESSQKSQSSLLWQNWTINFTSSPRNGQVMTTSIQNFQFLSWSTIETTSLTTTAVFHHPSNVDHRISLCPRPTTIHFDSSFRAFVARHNRGLWVVNSLPHRYHHLYIAVATGRGVA